MSGSIDDSQFDAASSDSSRENQVPDSKDGETQNEAIPTSEDIAWAEADQLLSPDVSSPSVEPSPVAAASAVVRSGRQSAIDGEETIPLDLVETAFLASTASLLWLISYYLSVGAWMRIFFPAPIALVYLRWGQRSAWMSAIVSCLLLSVLMGPYLSLLFLIPYGLLGVQLGALWRRGATWGVSITLGTIVSTLSFFFRVWLLSAFIGEDLWAYLTGRITDLLEWMFNHLVNWGFVGVGMLGQPDITLVQVATIVMVIASDIVYLFTIHLTVWLLFERLKTPIPTPPRWVQILLEEE